MGSLCDPATGQPIGEVPDLRAGEVARLVALARASQPAWADLPFKARARVMREARTWLLDNRRRVLATIMRESGKTYEDALLFEL